MASLRDAFFMHLENDTEYNDFLLIYDQIQLTIIEHMDFDNMLDLYKPICDETFISSSYEEILYSTLQDVENVGFFFTNMETKNKLVALIACIDYHARSIEITLLCSNSNPTIRIRGAARTLMKSVLTFFRKQYPKYTITLRIGESTGEHNNTAENFYKSLGFTYVSPNDPTNNKMQFNGGRQHQKRVYWSKMTNAQLKSLAKDYKIVGIRNMERDDLIKAIKNKRKHVL